MDDSGGFAPPPPPPPSAGGGGNIPQRGLGDILSVAFDVYKANATKLITIVAIIVVPLTFVQALLLNTALKQADATVKINQATGEISVSTGGGFFRGAMIFALSLLISLMIQQLLTGSLTRGAAGSLLGRPVDVGASYGYALSRLGGLIGLALLVGIVSFVGYLFLVIPGVIIAVFLSMAVPAFIVERKGVMDSMSRSWELVSGFWWHTIGVIVVASILASIVNGIFGAIGGSSFIGSWILTAIGQIITAPFVALVAVVLYVDLRVRRESLTAAALGQELDAAQA
jgi:hypothetical protein